MKRLLVRIKNSLVKPKFSSSSYWENRYKRGGNSGSGSYGHLAEFKAKIINQFVKEKNIKTVIEFGCGDGNQLKLANYPQYIGLDVSAAILNKCIKEFGKDNSKSFFMYSGDSYLDNQQTFYCELALSLDVLFHLVEQDVYEKYLTDLFNASGKYVIIYSSNTEIPPTRPDSHEYHRVFTKDVERLIEKFSLIDIVKNDFPSKEFADEKGSLADFYIYQKNG